MFRRILVPLDGSDLSDGILIPLGRLVSSQGAGTLDLQEVVEGPASQGLAVDEKSNAARLHLSRLKSRLAKEGISATVLVDRGDPVQRILSRIRLVNPDLVAMATHGRSGLSRLVRGSVAEEILRHCSRPLLLVNPTGIAGAAPDGTFARILVPLDGSRHADAILPVVRRLAVQCDAKVILLCVEPDPKNAAASGVVTDRMTRALDPQRKFFAAGELDVSVEVAFGDPAQQILEVANKLRVHLVAMCTHGHSGFQRLRFGSVAESVLRECVCPLLVQRDETQ
jgi:nucleotide-binding universal stress UspA family protein